MSAQCFTWILVISGFGPVPHFHHTVLLIVLEEVIVLSCTNATIVQDPPPVVELFIPPQSNNTRNVVYICVAQAHGAVLEFWVLA